MIAILLLSFFFYAYGVAYVVFAYREPPPHLTGAFNIRLPLLFALLLGLVPDENKVKVGRLSTGALFIVLAVIGTIRQLYYLFLGWA